MAKVFGHDKDTAMRLRNKSRRVIGNAEPPRAVLLPKRSEGGGGSKFFRLAEDGKPGAIYAFETNRADDDPSDELVQVYNWAGLIDDAQAGYHALFVWVDGEWVFAQGPCITPCTHTGSLNVGTPPDGIVGDPYEHTVTGTNVTNISIAGLPPGLSADGGAITGTPTEAGTTLVTVTATAGDCTLTEIIPITIAGGV